MILIKLRLNNRININEIVDIPDEKIFTAYIEIDV